MFMKCVIFLCSCFALLPHPMRCFGFASFYSFYGNVVHFKEYFGGGNPSIPWFYMYLPITSTMMMDWCPSLDSAPGPSILTYGSALVCYPPT